MKTFRLSNVWRRALAPLFFVVAIFAANAVSAAAQTGNQAADRQLQLWRSFSPPNGGFDVSLPAQPEGGSGSFEAHNGEIKFFGYESKSNGSTYTVVHLDFPAVIADLTKTDHLIEDSFDRGREAILQKKSAVLMNEKKITAFGFPAREFTMQEGVKQTKVQMILTKQRLFIIACTTPSMRNMPEMLTKIYQAESDKFFNSFEILDNQKKQ